jgi:hypothetical protein
LKNNRYSLVFGFKTELCPFLTVDKVMSFGLLSKRLAMYTQYSFDPLEAK